jgi:hypothetical protein
VIILLMSGCGTYRPLTPTYQEICKTAKSISIITNALCAFQASPDQRLKQTRLLKQLDSLNIILHQQLEYLP